MSTTATIDASPRLWTEFWVSLASLLRSYTAAHGLNRSEQATVELGEVCIIVRAGSRWLELERNEQTIRWTREDHTGGTLDFTVEGRLKDPSGAEEEMDMQAEAWARELMR